MVATTIDDERSTRPAPMDPAHIDLTPPPSTEVCELLANEAAFASAPSGCELPAQVDEWRYVERGTYFVRPFNTGLRRARPGDLEAWFETSRGNWYWWGGGAAMARPVGVGGPEYAPYIRVAITPITGVPTPGEQCQGAEPHPVPPVPSSPSALAQQLVASPGVAVLDAPRSVQKFGRDAVHVRFTVTEQCPADAVFVLWRAFPPEDDIYTDEHPSKADRHDGDIVGVAEHVFDVWVLEVQGEHLVISTNYPVNSNNYLEEDLAKLNELLDSIRFEFTE